MAEEMEDTNSWNEMIFRQIKARKDWIMALIWRKRMEHENDTDQVEAEKFEVKKKVDVDHENLLFTKWCEERKDNYDALLEEKKESPMDRHAPEAEELNKA